MRVLVCVLTLALSVSLVAVAFGQTLEVALKCEDAKKKLVELAKTPATDAEDISRITKAVGTAVLMSCDAPSGRTVCYQCIGKDQKLRSLEVLHNFKAKSLEIKGDGCRCSERK
jgi:hypothetical protein